MIFNFLKPQGNELEELNIKFSADLLAKRAVFGILVLAVRRIGLQLIQTFSTIILARILFPEVFGVFTIMVFFVDFLAFLPSQGFVSAIIQKKERISSKDISTIFWTIISLSFLMLGIFWLSTPYIINFYKGGVTMDTLLIRLTGLAILLVNLRLISFAILERQLKYMRLTIIELGETVVIQIIAVFMAFRGFGVESLVVGYLVGKSFGALAAYFFGPIKAILNFSTKALKRLLAFAVHYQIYSFTNMVSGAIAPIYVGRIIGTTGVGYLTWAGGLGLAPWAFAELVGRVIFPVLSRSQKNKAFFVLALDKAIELSFMVTLPFFTLIFVFATPITVIVYTAKWLPAIWALRFYVLLGLTASISTVAASALLALGQVKYVRNVSLISAITFWVLSLILVPKFGFSAQPLAWFLGSTIQLALVVKIVGTTRVKYWDKLVIYLLASIISVISVFSSMGQIESIFKLTISILLALLIYGLLIWIFRRNHILFYLRQLKVVPKNSI